ncbi:hypothetical protein ISCGN_030976 [Ixodes scapularis]
MPVSKVSGNCHSLKCQSRKHRRRGFIHRKKKICIDQVQFEDEEDVMVVFNWFEEYHILGKLRTNHGIGIRIPPQLPPALWTVEPLMENHQPRGTNCLVAWHRRLGVLIRETHPGLLFLRRLRAEQDQIEGVWKVLTCTANSDPERVFYVGVLAVELKGGGGGGGRAGGRRGREGGGLKQKETAIAKI